MILAGALAGCTSGAPAPQNEAQGPSGDPPSPPVEPSTPPGDPVVGDGPIATGEGTTHYVTDFDEAAVASVRNAAEFRIQGGRKGFTLYSTPYTTDNNPFSVINLEYAHAAGLTGTNQLIAIVDSDFRTTHQELAGKTVYTYGVLEDNPDLDHGTGVAAIAAGKRDDVGMMGVAPDASLHLTAAPQSPADLGLATEDAWASGAIVQNNSWGFIDRDTRRLITVELVDAAPGASLSEKLAFAVGFSAAGWTGYLDALEQFAASGVVVFALSNDYLDTSAHIMAGLPSLRHSLQGSWITAGNAIARYDPDGTLSGATRLSAGCLETAAYCLLAEGIVYTASDAGDDAYVYKPGSSFSAPQVSGAVALLAQAFPDLQPSEIVDRLLASADNSFFATEEIDGSVDFGNGVSHSYSDELGHGFLDIRAALLPIGTTGIPATTAANGAVMPLSQVSMVSGAAHGNALATALAGRELALFDGLGTAFRVPAEVLVADVDTAGLDKRLRRFTAGANRQSGSDPGSFGFTSGTAGMMSTDTPFVFGWAENVGAQFGLNPAASPVFADPSSLLGLAPDAVSVGSGHQLSGGGTFGVYGFAGNHDGTGIFGLGVSRTFPVGAGATLAFGVAGAAEKGSFLGLKLADDSSFETATVAFNAALTVPLGGLEFFAASEFGLANAGDAGLMASIEPARYSGFALGSRWQGVWSQNDVITLAVRQPMRIESGHANLRLPVGRDRGGQVLYDDVPVDLEPEARQLDFGIDYTTSLAPDTGLRLGAVFSHNHEHTSGQTAAAVMAAMVHRF